MLLIGAPSLAQTPGCLVHGALHDEPIEVIGGWPVPFDVYVTARDVAITPSHEEHGPAIVTLTTAIAFQGRLRHPLFSTAGATASLDGVVRFRPATAFDTSRRVDGGLLVSVYESEISVRTVVPCNRVQLATPMQERVRGAIGMRGRRLWARDNTLRVRSQPDSAGFSELEIFDPSATPLGEVARQGGWVRVAIHSERVAVDGWARESDVDARPTNVPSLGVPYGAEPGRGIHGGARPTGSSSTYVGTAIVDPGTAMLRDPGGAAWGVITTREPVFVEAVRGQPWVRVFRVWSPGGEAWVETLGRDAFVPATAVHLPARSRQ